MHIHKKPIETPTLSFPLPDLQMVKVPAMPVGETFLMGDADSEYDDERPVHPVNIPYDYYIGQFQVTQGLYQTIMGENPSNFKGDRRPVETVSWEDANTFIGKLNEDARLLAFLLDSNIKGTFRLPTEAEWEYAARGGIYWKDGYIYCGSDNLKQVGWYRENSGLETKPVGLLLPNQLGLYDMSGNVYEWCEDDWHGDYNSPDRPDNGKTWKDTPSRGAYRVVRGGYYFNASVYCRPAYRFHYSPGSRDDYLGFRLVFSPQLQESPSDNP